jgi:hypothetical protein
VGELFVEYDIDLFDPRVPVPIGQNIPMSHIASGAGTATDAAPLTGGAIRAGSTLNGLAFTNATVTIRDVGRYLVTVAVSSTAITASPTSSAGANVSNVSIVANNTQASSFGFVLNSTGSLCRIVDVTSPSGVINLTAGTGVVAGNFDVFICQLSSGLTLRPKNEEERICRLEKFLASFAPDAFPGSLVDFKEKELKSLDCKLPYLQACEPAPQPSALSRFPGADRREFDDSASLSDVLVDYVSKRSKSTPKPVVGLAVTAPSK